MTRNEYGDITADDTGLPLKQARAEAQELASATLRTWFVFTINSADEGEPPSWRFCINDTKYSAVEESNPRFGEYLAICIPRPAAPIYTPKQRAAPGILGPHRKENK